MPCREAPDDVDGGLRNKVLAESRNVHVWTTWPKLSQDGACDPASGT